MNTVLKIRHKAYWCEVKYDEGKTNPYKVYKLTMGTDRYGYPAEHRKKVVEYCDMNSVLVHLAQDALGLDTGSEKIFLT